MTTLQERLFAIRKEKSPVAVLGLGKSGTAAAITLARYGFCIECFEGLDEAAFQQRYPEEYAALSASSLIVHFASSEVLEPRRFALMILSPGIGPNYPLARSFFEQGVPVTNELELGLLLLGTRSFAVTGTNGKSTTASLLHHILVSSGKPSVLCGNIGTPVMSLLPQEWSHDMGQRCRPEHIAVVEISSYQIESSMSYAPSLGIFLNLSPNHLERHGDMQGYFDAKAKLFRRMSFDSAMIFPYGDEAIRMLAGEVLATPLPIGESDDRLEEYSVWARVLDSEHFLLKTFGQNPKQLSLQNSSLVGVHNVYNAAAAALAASYAGCTRDQIQEALNSFSCLPHRIEKLPQYSPRQPLIINDSKATTIAATHTALEAISEAYPEREMFLLVGGQSKKGPGFEEDWTNFFRDVLHKNESLAHPLRCICFGGDGALLQELAQRAGMTCERIEKLAHCVKVLAEAEQQSESTLILLSPGCASFDEFRDFEDRGDTFRAWVEAYFREAQAA